MNTVIRSLAIALGAAALAACAGKAPEEGKTVDELLAEKDLRIVEELRQLTAFNIHSWIYVDRQNVVLRDGPSRHYLVALNTPCNNLRFARNIAFTSFGRTLRNTDYLIVTDAPGNAERCFMKSFYRLEKIQ